MDEIRLHLSARRPHGQDDSDPAIAQAVARAAAEPTLAAWADAEKRFDTEFADRLRGVQPPPGLRDTILAGAAVGRRHWWDWFNGTAFRSFRNSEMFAAAAIVLLLGIALAWNYFRGDESEANWQTFAATQVSEIENAEVSVQMVVSTMPEIQQWLNEQTCPAPASLPVAVRSLKIHGCSKAMWKGEPMSIVCFLLDRGKEVHLVTVSRRNLPTSPPEGRPVFGAVKGYATASWSEGDHAMMLLGKVDEAELRKLMGMAAAAWTPTRWPAARSLAAH